MCTFFNADVVPVSLLLFSTSRFFGFWAGLGGDFVDVKWWIFGFIGSDGGRVDGGGSVRHWLNVI